MASRPSRVGRSKTRPDSSMPAARPPLERAVTMRERVLGPGHPHSVATRRALAELAAEGDDASTIT